MKKEQILEHWSSDYERSLLMSQRFKFESLHWILDKSFFVVKYCWLKRVKINPKEASDGPFKNEKVIFISIKAKKMNSHFFLDIKLAQT